MIFNSFMTIANLFTQECFIKSCLESYHRLINLNTGLRMSDGRIGKVNYDNYLHQASGASLCCCRISGSPPGLSR